MRTTWVCHVRLLALTSLFEIGQSVFGVGVGQHDLCGAGPLPCLRFVRMGRTIESVALGCRVPADLVELSRKGIGLVNHFLFGTHSSLSRWFARALRRGADHRSNDTEQCSAFKPAQERFEGGETNRFLLGIVVLSFQRIPTVAGPNASLPLPTGCGSIHRQVDLFNPCGASDPMGRLLR